MTMGTRYTNAGVVCMASSIGLKTESNRLLRAARMPKGTPIRQQKSTEERTMARVVMVSAHRPRRPINTIEIIEKMARGMPENRQAAMATTAIMISGCIAFSPASKPVSVCSMGHLMA